jgi:hypothetical protein
VDARDCRREDCVDEESRKPHGARITLASRCRQGRVLPVRWAMVVLSHDWLRYCCTRRTRKLLAHAENAEGAENNFGGWALIHIIRDRRKHGIG